MINVISSELSTFSKHLTEAKKQSVGQKINKVFKGCNDRTERITVDQYNKEIDEAMERAAQGEFTTMEELEKEIQIW